MPCLSIANIDIKTLPQLDIPPPVQELEPLRDFITSGMFIDTKFWAFQKLLKQDVSGDRGTVTTPAKRRARRACRRVENFSLPLPPPSNCVLPASETGAGFQPRAFPPSLDSDPVFVNCCRSVPRTFFVRSLLSRFLVRTEDSTESVCILQLSRIIISLVQYSTEIYRRAAETPIFG